MRNAAGTSVGLRPCPLVKSMAVGWKQRVLPRHRAPADQPRRRAEAIEQIAARRQHGKCAVERIDAHLVHRLNRRDGQVDGKAGRPGVEQIGVGLGNQRPPEAALQLRPRAGDQARDKCIVVGNVNPQVRLGVGQRHRLLRRRSGKHDGHGFDLGCLRRLGKGNGRPRGGARTAVYGATAAGVAAPRLTVQLTSNFSSLMASKSCTPPPTRLVV